jgi:hypothetical protein
MALNIQTDKKFDAALNWLVKLEQKTKSTIVRELVLNCFRFKKSGFQFGAFADLEKTGKRSLNVIHLLKQIDKDHDLR